MKRYDNSKFKHDKYRTKQWKQEHSSGGFRCSHCKQFVIINDIMGTANRNHCNMCLWSNHVDINKGDRQATCHGGMQPIGLTFKQVGYGRQGEVMLIHLCSACQKLSINRIARDDNDQQVLQLFNSSMLLTVGIKKRLQKAGINLLSQDDEQELSAQLLGVQIRG